MKTVAKWAARAAVAIVAIVAIAWLGLFAVSESILHKHYPFPANPPALSANGADVAAGAKLARQFGCVGCHGEDLRGQVMKDDLLIGRLYAPNLTLVTKGYSDAQLAAIIRGGVRPDGSALFIMPSEAFSRLTDTEISQIIAYVRSRPAGGAPASGQNLRPQILVQIGLAAGKFKSAPTLVAEYRARPLPDYGPDTSAGRETARACAACHGPDLKGDFGPDLRIAAAYDIPAFQRLLRHGIALDGKPVKPVGAPGESKTEGLMAEVAPIQFGRLSDADIAALHAYLKARLDHLPN